MRSTKRYESRAQCDVALRTRLRELAFDEPRLGYRQLHQRLLAEGFTRCWNSVYRF